MKNPNGSDIPGARDAIVYVLDNFDLNEAVEYYLRKALNKMTRQKPVRRAKTQQKIRITDQIAEQIRWYQGNANMSNADIAVAVGLPACASGRVSEVLQGLR